jgi:hypothetical protein
MTRQETNPVGSHSDEEYYGSIVQLDEDDDWFLRDDESYGREEYSYYSQSDLV